MNNAIISLTALPTLGTNSFGDTIIDCEALAASLELKDEQPVGVVCGDTFLTLYRFNGRLITRRFVSRRAMRNHLNSI